MTLRPATDADLPHLFGWTHALWSDGLAPEAYATRLRGLLASAWGRENFRYWVLEDAGERVSACKVYRFTMDLAGSPCEVIGFGAVFTPEEARGKGYAAAMLAGIMERQAGQGLALLFSDIAPAYYERLGFRALATPRGAAPAEAGEAAFRPWEPDFEALVPFFQPPGPLAFARTPAYWDYLLARTEPTLWAYAPGGFIATEIQQDALVILEAGWLPGVDPVALLRATRALAAAQGLGSVRGWLPPVAAEAGFSLSPVTKGVPMVAALDGRAVPTDVAFWGIDHF